MHLAAVVAAATALLVPAVDAHGGAPAMPKLFGRRAVQDLKARALLSSSPPQSRYYDRLKAAHTLPERSTRRRGANQTRLVLNVNGPCGAGVGSCDAGYCCSSAGWCGQGSDYCAAPDCQFNYGPACDANTIPRGPSTSSVPRPHLGGQPYGGVGIYDCVNPGNVAITYDDGPSSYTAHILDVLKMYNASATFFITGNNFGKGEIDNEAYPWASYIRRMYAEGHQIASHTWSHQDLGSSAASQGQQVLTKQQRLNQMYYNEMAFRNILGFFPTYMRPPYSDCDVGSGCQADMASLGYHIVYFDLDTSDYLSDAPSLIQNSKNIVQSTLSTTNPAEGEWLVIAHDIHYQTAYNLTAFMVQTLLAQGYTPVTVGQCLGDPPGNWYRSAGNGSVTSPTGSASPTVSPTSSAPVTTNSVISQDGTCGGTTGYTCTGSSFGNCCSSTGWCGSTDSYCGASCQPNSGTCGNSSSGTATTTSSAPSTSSSAKISANGTCGGQSGQTCLGSAFGNCCSLHGWCGTGTAYCGGGCQTAFGSCGT